ncbi:hypothetical protein LJC08_01650 [Methanimicrococcus sp. OttesenSCG-928-J09]|nr:hypothetical protein [Methanimicrococcus sp. OttesenSCG-928-J09]
MIENENAPVYQISKTAYRIFGSIAEKMKFQFLSKNLKKSRLYIEENLYKSLLLFMILIITAGGFFVEILLFILKKTEFLPNEEKYLFLSLLTGAAAFFSIVTAVSFFCLLPFSKAYDRKIRIEQQLPFATNYMAAMAVAGVRTEIIFQSLSQKKMENVYKELSEEAKTLDIQINCFGKDYPSALQTLSEETASPLFSEFIHGAKNTFISGGSFQKFIISKKHEYQSLAVRRKEKYFQTLEMLSEIYITVFLAMPIFFMILLYTMTPLSGPKPEQMSTLTYLAVPFLGIFFLLILEIINEKEDV